MIVAQTIAENGLLTHDEVMETLTKGLGGKFKGQKVLVLIPDHTRSLPLPELFRMVVAVLHDVRERNFMVALGTHPGYPEDGLNQLVGISAEERATTFRHVGLLNHAWDDPTDDADPGERPVVGERRPAFGDGNRPRGRARCDVGGRCATQR